MTLTRTSTDLYPVQPFELEAEDEVDYEVIEEWIRYRHQAAVAEAKCDEIAFDVINACESILKAMEKKSGKCWEAAGGSVELSYRDVKPTPKTCSDLEAIAFDIEQEQKRLEEKNATRLAELRAELEVLTTSPTLKMYQEEYEKTVRRMTTKKPVLTLRTK